MLFAETNFDDNDIFISMRLVCVFTCFVALFHLPLFSQQLIINEVSQGTSSKEYVEFVVAGNPTCITPVPCMDLRGVIIDDNNGHFASGGGTGIAPGAVRFANTSFWSCIPQGTLIVVYNNNDLNPALPPNDLSMSDGNCRLIIPINSTLIEGQSISPTSAITNYPAAGSWVAGAGDWSQVSMNNSNDSFLTQATISSAAPTHAVSWGNNSTNTQIYFSGSASGKVFYFSNSTDNNPFLQSNWVDGNVGADETPGSANNAANDAWIGGMNPQCGISNNIQLTLSSTPTGCGANCTGSANVIISGGTAPYQIVWSNAATTQSITNLCAGTYTVTVTDNAGCSIDDQISVSSGTSNLSVQANTTNESCTGLCDGAISSSVSGGSQPYSYSWSNGATSTAINALCPDNYTLTVTDNAGCTANTNATVSVGATIPDATITTSGPFTTTDNVVQMSANSSGGTWTADCGSCITPTGQFNPQSVVAGSYEICYTNGNGACSDMDCQTIIVTEGCTPQTTSEDAIGCPNVSVDINGVTYTQPGAYSETFIGQNGCDSTHTVFYTWHNTFPVNLSTTQCEGDTFEINGVLYTESTQFNEVVVDANGCVVTNSYSIVFEDCSIPEYAVFIPNTFTPNNDNVNDFFEIVLSGGMLESGFIMNRWGNIVHEFSPTDLTWNGETQQGLIVPDGVYTYSVTVQKFNGVPEQFHGFVTVIR